MVANYAFCGRICEFLEMTDKQILDEITKGIQKIHNSYIDVRQVKAWEGAIPNLRKVFCEIDENIWFVFEYKLPFSCERIDLVLLGKDENDKSIAIIGELKGWDKVEQVDDLVVKVRNEIFQHPELQLSNYLGKLLFSHTSSNYFKFVGFIWLYNLSHGNLSINKHKFFCKDSHHEVTEFINKFLSKGIELEEVERFTKGEYLQTSRLFDAIKENYDALLKSATNLVSKYSGIFIPSEEQTIILRKILDDYEKKASKCFLINGEPGSGKTYLAILILLEIIRRAKYTDKEGKNIVALGYRNNRLIYTIREIFKQ
ncbi:MAG: DUF2075 domain-containing protein, partial [Actinobacteria bacterium]|nr:DUF2075 domain-containing protein [Actinomycetota bacterium]